IPEMVEYSQMAHAETYGYVFENWRAQFPYKGGETVWTYNSHSPLSDWSIIDWFGQPKVTFYSVKRANEPIHVYANTGYMSWGAGDTLTAEVAAINDKFTPLEGAKLTARLLDADMKPVLAKTWKTNVPAGGYHSKLNKISWPIPKGTPAGFVFLETTLDSSSGEQLSRNVYCLRIAAALADPKARAAWKATPTEEVLNTKGPFLRTQVEKHPTTLHSEILNIKDQGKQAVVKVRIQNTGNKPAYPVRLTLTPDANSVLWSDNYFWLKPGETRIIEGIVRLDMAGIDLLTKTSKVPISDLKLTVSSWNIPAGKALVAAVR
ncbi:MAG: glycoside hydrolase family 2 protein, partial [Armatimonadota bacterium]